MEDELFLEDQDNFGKIKNLKEGKIKLQQLKLQLETHENRPQKIKQLKQDNYYKIIGWIVPLAIVYLAERFLSSSAVSNLPTASMLAPFKVGLTLIWACLVARVLVLLPLFFGDKDESTRKFTLYKNMLADEEYMIEHLKKVIEKTEEEVERLQAEDDLKKAREEETGISEDDLVFHWKIKGM